MKTPKWMLKLALFLDLNQESGYAWIRFNEQISSGEILKEEWLDEISRSWFILQDAETYKSHKKIKKVVFHGFSQWECVEQKIEGDIVNASTFLACVIKGIEQKPEWGYGDC